MQNRGKGLPDPREQETIARLHTVASQAAALFHAAMVEELKAIPFMPPDPAPTCLTCNLTAAKHFEHFEHHEFVPGGEPARAMEDAILRNRAARLARVAWLAAEECNAEFLRQAKSATEIPIIGADKMPGGRQ